MATGGKNVQLGIKIGANVTEAVQAFASLKRSVEQQSQALQAARAEATRLAQAVKESDQPSPALVKSFQDAKAHAAALKQEVSQGQQQLEGMRRSLAGAGIDTKNLAESMRRVAQEAKAAQEAQRQAKVVQEARSTLDVKPQADITAQINRAKEAYAQLKASGTLTATELGQAYLNLQSRLNELNRQTNGWAEGLGRVRESAAALLGALAGWAGAVKLAASFEAAMVDFARATNQTKAEVMGLANGFRDLAQKYGLGADAIAEIATVGGKLGVAKEDLNQFVEAVAKAAVNFDMLPQEAAKAMAMLSSLLKIPVAQLESFAGAINAVADGVGVMERDIINALARAGSSAQELGLSRNQAVAMAAALIKLGADAESAGSAIRTFSSRLRFAINDQGQAGASLKRLVGDVRGFAQLLYTDGQAAVNQFFAALNRMPGPERFAVLKDIFQEGLDTENINKLATGTETYARALKAATGDAQSFSSALERLTQMKLGTTQSEFAQLAQALHELHDTVDAIPASTHASAWAQTATAHAGAWPVNWRIDRQQRADWVGQTRQSVLSSLLDAAGLDAHRDWEGVLHTKSPLYAAATARPASAIESDFDDASTDSVERPTRVRVAFVEPADAISIAWSSVDAYKANVVVSPLRKVSLHSQQGQITRVASTLTRVSKVVEMVDGVADVGDRIERLIDTSPVFAGVTWRRGSTFVASDSGQTQAVRVRYDTLTYLADVNASAMDLVMTKEQQ